MEDSTALTLSVSEFRVPCKFRAQHLPHSYMAVIGEEVVSTSVDDAYMSLSLYDSPTVSLLIKMVLELVKPPGTAAVQRVSVVGHRRRKGFTSDGALLSK